jgi:hypothetical protein
VQCAFGSAFALTIVSSCILLLVFLTVVEPFQLSERSNESFLFLLFCFFYPEVTSKLFLVGNIKPQTKTSIAYTESLLVSHIAIYLHMILSVSFKCIVVKLLETKIFFALLKIKIKIKIFFDVINELTKSSQIY